MGAGLRRWRCRGCCCCPIRSLRQQEPVPRLGGLPAAGADVETPPPQPGSGGRKEAALRARGVCHDPAGPRPGWVRHCIRSGVPPSPMPSGLGLRAGAEGLQGESVLQRREGWCQDGASRTLVPSCPRCGTSASTPVTSASSPRYEPTRRWLRYFFLLEAVPTTAL